MSSFATTITSSDNARLARPSSVRSGGRRSGPIANGAAVPGLPGDPRSSDLAGLGASLWTPGLLDRLQEPISRYHE